MEQIKVGDYVIVEDKGVLKEYNVRRLHKLTFEATPTNVGYKNVYDILKIFKTESIIENYGNDYSGNF